MASNGLIEDDGTSVLYFYTWAEDSWPAPSTLGRATAPDPVGPWTADDAPVLEPGPAGAWDARAVRKPGVVCFEDGYVMYYLFFELGTGGTTEVYLAMHEGSLKP